MTYEQKYKEALERAKDMLSYKEVRREDMEYLFPELKESEDEKIRKELIEFTKTRGGFKQEWIAWLKKQSERKPDLYPLCTTVKEKIRTYIANNFITDEVVKTDVKSIVRAMEEGVRLGKEENKSTWSEEDENRFKNLIELIEQSNEGKGTKEDFIKFINRLNSLRPRTGMPSDEQMNDEP